MWILLSWKGSAICFDMSWNVVFLLPIIWEFPGWKNEKLFFLILVHDELHETNYKLVRNFRLQGNFVCKKQSVLLSTWCMGNSWGSCHLSSTYTLSVLAPVWISPLFLCHLGYSERLRSWHGFYHMLFMWRKYMCSAMVKMGTLE